MSFELPTLPFALNALEPFISKTTLEFHYGKHHQAYVTNLNKLLPGSGFEQATLKRSSKKQSAGFSTMPPRSGTTHSTGTASVLTVVDFRLES